MQNPHVIVSARMLDGELVHHVLSKAQYDGWKSGHGEDRAPIVPLSDRDGTSLYELVEGIGKDFVLKRSAEAYVDSVRGEIVERINVDMPYAEPSV